jgi:formylglycine-generating enzyme required for sulfatase activity
LEYDKDQYDVVGRRHFDTRIPTSSEKYDPAPIEFIRPIDSNVEWRNTLVTNSEFCDFLNTLHANGVSNVRDGGQIFFNENMIDERGGRIHFDKSSSRYVISPGYENHPVYWITWIGAAAFAASKGLRLPLRHEIDQLVNNADVSLRAINAGHRSDDVYPIHSQNYLPGEINDLVGNLAVWCKDGNDQASLDTQSSTRYIYGTAWNRPATLHEITKGHSRPIVGNSRAVGIRLVRDLNTAPISQTELIDRLQSIPKILNDKSGMPLKDRDQAIIKLISH